MNWYRREPTLNEILSDCIIRAVMESDGIDPQELAATLRQVGRKLVPRPQSDGGGDDQEAASALTKKGGSATLVRPGRATRRLFPR
jgi:hypothetical protein